MKILVLEDSSNRINYFVEKFSGCDLTITENAFDAILYLKKDVFDCIFLDHDLGDNNGCGIDVAVFLSSNMNLNNDAIIVIHSWNVPATASMISFLPNAYAIPFGSVEFYGLDI